MIVDTNSRDQLMRWFDSNTGLWRNYWWQGASILTSFNDFAYLDENVKNVYGATWEHVYNNAPANRPYKLKSSKAKRESGFLNDFYDDEGWWALALIGALDNTGRREYLDEAIAIWYDMNAGFNKPSCGGLPWKKDEGSGPLAIPNCTLLQD
jgi:predicted alpha-1,6-mannanase (GH76 family)